MYVEGQRVWPSLSERRRTAPEQLEVPKESECEKIECLQKLSKRARKEPIHKND